MNSEQESKDVQFIPENVLSGITVLGKTYPVKSVIQAVIAAGCLLCALFLLLKVLLNMQIGLCIGISATSALLGGDLALQGIGGEDLLSFAHTVLRFKKRARVAYYNPDCLQRQIENDKEEKKEFILTTLLNSWIHKGRAYFNRPYAAETPAFDPTKMKFKKG